MSNRPAPGLADFRPQKYLGDAQPAIASPGGSAENDKDDLRRYFRALREAMPNDQRQRLDAARRAIAEDLLAGLGQQLARQAGGPLRPVAVGQTAPTVAIYLSRPPEPDSNELAAGLYRSGWQVIVPSPGRAGKPWAEPAWSWYGEPPQTGPHGIPVVPDRLPTADLAVSDAETMPSADLAVADVIIMPGLAGTPDGVRLGAGGGWYDRALLSARPDAPRWLLLNDNELVESLPVEPHDQRVDAIITPTGVRFCVAATTRS